MDIQHLNETQVERLRFLADGPDMGSFPGEYVNRLELVEDAAKAFLAGTGSRERVERAIASTDVFYAAATQAA